MPECTYRCSVFSSFCHLSQLLFLLLVNNNFFPVFFNFLLGLFLAFLVFFLASSCLLRTRIIVLPFVACFNLPSIVRIAVQIKEGVFYHKETSGPHISCLVSTVYAVSYSCHHGKSFSSSVVRGILVEVSCVVDFIDSLRFEVCN